MLYSGSLAARRHPRDRAEQRLRVAVARLVEDPVRRAGLDELARVHDEHAVGLPGDDAEVVRDQQHRHPDLGAQAREQLEDLILRRHVERRRRLVGDEERGLAGERRGDRHALAHPAGELVREAVELTRRARQADELEQLRRPIPSRSCRRAAVDAQRLGDLVADRHRRIEGRERILEDDADPVAAQLADAPLRGVRRRRGLRAGSSRRRSAPPVGQQTAAARARSSSCRSPTRRRARPSHPGRSRSDTPSTAWTVERRRAMSTRRSATSSTGDCSSVTGGAASPRTRRAARRR